MNAKKNERIGNKIRYNNLNESVLYKPGNKEVKGRKGIDLMGIIILPGLVAKNIHGLLVFGREKEIV